MKICILETDPIHAHRLETLLVDLQPGLHDVEIFSSVRSCLKHMEEFFPDLLFRDLSLGDHDEALLREKPACPVVLMADSQMPAALLAGLDGFDCLPKPADRERLKDILQKYTSMQAHFTGNVDRFLTYIRERQRTSKRFLVKSKTDYQTLLPEDIVYIRADKKVISLADKNNQHFHVEDYSLNALTDLLDEQQFYRVNRKFILNVNYIRRFRPLPDSRMSVELAIPIDPEILISRENALSFRRWLGDC